jgi:nitrite reductase/ring-hydroxylating ferredoxin subunit
MSEATHLPIGARRWHAVPHISMETRMSEWVRVAGRGDVAEGACLGVRVGSKEVAIYHLPGGEYRATDNVCTHEYALLSDGWLENGCIECPLHAAQFDVRTGKAMSAPADEDIAVYPLKVEGDDLMVQMPG